jgi:hypothetical protein
MKYIPNSQLEVLSDLLGKTEPTKNLEKGNFSLSEVKKNG